MNASSAEMLVVVDARLNERAVAACIAADVVIVEEEITHRYE